MSVKENYPKDWIRISFMINSKTLNMYIMDGDRERCSHDCYPPCCDTNYIGLELMEKYFEKKRYGKLYEARVMDGEG